ncbi:YcgN family cysteine cluster protein [Aeromonas caviae]|uniref:YcgN family cysteine cluster protein n=1 Tax=Aeromonas caviae TaxID=648 RepID=UPI0029D95B60|nr:YcgN family cysteine cluster protein [Aeromonas caviae]MDX7845215.1 YcgN family cysteine cluster protein [Aeromonas caviae]
MQQSEPVQTASFWQVKSLQQMTTAEWESLCDGCGKCCLNKLIDEDTEELVFTNVACNLLNTKTCQCSDYGNRFKKEPDCLQITHDKIAEFNWLPSTCAYRLLAEGQTLPEWHPLITGSRSAMHQAGQSVRGKVIHEVHAGDWADHIITWAS